MVDERLTLAGSSKWRNTWPDMLAFGAGLAMAWQFRWETTDLVWSLWLSSLLVGYSMIVWSIFGPAVYMGIKAWTGRELLKTAPVLPMALGGAAYLIGGLFMLAFFTVHFGMFHFIHSIFLNLFFPVTPTKGELPLDAYFGVLGQYWYFVPLAALAERQAFRLAPSPAPETPEAERRAKTATVTGEDITAAVRATHAGMQGGMMRPYKNVVRMHLLIFFFAFAHFAKIESFLVYAVVYAVYFFPWRVTKSRPAPAAAG